MKQLHSLLTVAVLVACTALFANDAQAAYAFDMVDPGYTAATAVGSLPTTCRLLAADVTHNQPIYIDCNSVNGLSANPIAGSFTTLLTTGAFTGGAGSNIALNTNKFTVNATSGNTAVGGTLGVTGTTTAAAINASGVTTTTGGLVSIVTNDFHTPYSTAMTANPISYTTYGTCTVAAVNGGTCIPLALSTGRTYTVTNFDIIATGSAATCTGVKLEDTNGTPVVITTLAAAQLTSGAHNVPLTATLGVGFGAGSGLTVSQGVQILVNGSACTTTTAFNYEITYTIQ